MPSLVPVPHNLNYARREKYIHHLLRDYPKPLRRLLATILHQVLAREHWPAHNQYSLLASKSQFEILMNFIGYTIRGDMGDLITAVTDVTILDRHTCYHFLQRAIKTSQQHFFEYLDQLYYLGWQQYQHQDEQLKELLDLISHLFWLNAICNNGKIFNGHSHKPMLDFVLALQPKDRKPVTSVTCQLIKKIANVATQQVFSDVLKIPLQYAPADFNPRWRGLIPNVPMRLLLNVNGLPKFMRTAWYAYCSVQRRQLVSYGVTASLLAGITTDHLRLIHDILDCRQSDITEDDKHQWVDALTHFLRRYDNRKPNPLHLMLDLFHRLLSPEEPEIRQSMVQDCAPGIIGWTPIIMAQTSQHRQQSYHHLFPCYPKSTSQQTIDLLQTHVMSDHNNWIDNIFPTLYAMVSCFDENKTGYSWILCYHATKARSLDKTIATTIEPTLTL